MVDLAKFDHLVGSIARKANVNVIISQEDVKQELFLKLWKILPDIQDMPDADIFSYVKTILKNHLTDIVRFHSRRPDTSEYSNEAAQGIGQEVESMVRNEISDASDILNGSRMVSPDDALELKELNHLIDSYINSLTDPEAKLYLRESLNPSEDTLDKWEALVLTYPRYQTYTTIPPTTLAKILGIDQKKYYKVINAFEAYLHQFGYRSHTLRVA